MIYSMPCFHIFCCNGSEFTNPRAIEYRDYLKTSGTMHRIYIFYCDGGYPYQKGACEANHELILRVIPKETSMDFLTQEDIFLIMNHINSYKKTE